MTMRLNWREDAACGGMWGGATEDERRAIRSLPRRGLVLRRA